MDPTTIGILTLSNGALGNTLNAIGLGRLVGAGRKRVSLEAEGFRYSGMGPNRFSPSDDLPKHLTTYELIELNIVNHSNRKILIDEVNVFVHHPYYDDGIATSPYTITNDLQLEADDRKKVRLEPWPLLTTLLFELEHSDSALHKATLASLDKIELSFGLVVKDAKMKRLPGQLKLNANHTSFLREAPDSLASVILRTYRSLKQGSLVGDPFGQLEPGQHDGGESHIFSLAVRDALSTDPELEAFVLSKSEQFPEHDPYSDFAELSAEEQYPHLGLSGLGEDAIKFRLLRSHLIKHVDSEVWKNQIATDYLVNRISRHLKSTSILLDGVHPDFLLTPNELMNRFGLFEDFPGYTSNGSIIEMLEILRRSSSKEGKTEC